MAEGGIKTKDPVVEFLRIIGTLMVIGTHVKLPNTVDGIPVKTNILISCFAGDGVTVFWVILGFFLLGGEYIPKIKGLCKKVLLPLAVFTLFLFFFYGFIMDGDIVKSVSHPIEDYGNLVTDGLFKWHNVVSGGAHLWFLYVYAVMILLFPALKGVREFTAKIPKRDLVLTCVLLGLLLINDIRLDGLLTISTASFGSVRGAFIIILYGDILYRNREMFEGKKLLGIAGLCLFVITNIVRAYIQYRCYSLDPISEEPIFWYTSYAVLCTTGLVVFGYGFSDLIKKFGKVIAHIGSRTFCVYLFHFVILLKLSSLGLSSWLNANLLPYPGPAVYTLAYMLIVFAVSYVFGELVMGLISIIKRALHSSGTASRV